MNGIYNDANITAGLLSLSCLVGLHLVRTEHCLLYTSTDVTVDGFALWIVLLICVGVFLGSFMDAIAGGGGIITGPTYLIAFSRLPAYYARGTNKLSAGIGTVFSTARFIKNGLVDWKLFTPAVALALAGSVAGTWLQHHTPDVVLKYLLLFVLPVVAFVTLRNRSWPDQSLSLIHI